MPDSVRRITYEDILPRVETGPTQFGNDWPGVFIRGDNAFAMQMAIDTAIGLLDMEQPMSHFCKAQLKSISSTLGGCIVNPLEDNGL